MNLTFFAFLGTLAVRAVAARAGKAGIKLGSGLTAGARP